MFENTWLDRGLQVDYTWFIYDMILLYSHSYLIA